MERKIIHPTQIYMSQARQIQLHLFRIAMLRRQKNMQHNFQISTPHNTFFQYYFLCQKNLNRKRIFLQQSNFSLLQLTSLEKSQLPYPFLFNFAAVITITLYLQENRTFLKSPFFLHGQTL